MSTRRSLMTIVALCLMAFFYFLSLSSSAQTPDASSQVSGLLTDPTGAVVTGATVLVQSETSGRTWTTTTGKDGGYTVTGLPAGDYEVHVRQNGFAEQVTTVNVSLGGKVTLPITLSIAAIVQQVNVNSGPADDGIDSRQIRETAARDLGEATESIPGVEKVRKAGIANDIAIRGMFHENVATTIDGARLYGACTGQMDPAAYHADLGEVDHVDIVKGPFDVSTQGVLGGFVKIVNRTADEHGLRLDSNVSTGSYGYYNPSMTAQAGNSIFHFLGGYSYRTSEEYSDGNGNRVSTIANYRNGDQNLQGFRTQSAWTKLAFQPGVSQRAEIGYARQQGGEVLYPYMMMDGIFDNADRFTARYDYLHPHPFLRSIHGLFYVDKVNHLMDNRLRSSAGMLPVSMSGQVVSFATGGRIDAEIARDVSAGVESYRRYWNSNGFMMMSSMGMGGSMTTYSHGLPGVAEFINGAYLTYRRALGKKLLLSSGARYDLSNSDAGSASSVLYQAYHSTTKTKAVDSGLSGNVRLSWQASERTSVFAGAGSNIRFPDPQERFYQSDSSMSNGWVGNPLLTHPRNTEVDLGLSTKQSRYTLSPLVFFGKLDNDITLYAASLLQMVPGVMSKTAETYANVQAHQWGGELTGSAPITTSLAAYGSLSYSRGTKVPQPVNSIFSSNLFQVPPLKGQLNLRYEHRHFYSEAAGIVTGRQDRIDSDEHELTTAGYSVFNFKLGYRTGSVHLEGGLNNMLGREYSEFLSYAGNPYSNGMRLPEPGRNFFVNMAWTLKRQAE